MGSVTHTGENIIYEYDICSTRIDVFKSLTFNSFLSCSSMHPYISTTQYRVVCTILVTSPFYFHFLFARDIQHTHFNSYCHNIVKSVFKQIPSSKI